MSTANRLMQELNLSEERLQQVTNSLKPLVDSHGGTVPYHLFLDALKEYGFTVADAQKVMGVFYAKAIFSETIAAWDYKPFNLVQYIRQIDNERSAN